MKIIRWANELLIIEFITRQEQLIPIVNRLMHQFGKCGNKIIKVSKEQIIWIGPYENT